MAPSSTNKGSVHSLAESALHLALKELWKLPVLVEEKDYAKELLETRVGER